VLVPRHESDLGTAWALDAPCVVEARAVALTLALAVGHRIAALRAEPEAAQRLIVRLDSGLW
jgi:hypothetical protein